MDSGPPRSPADTGLPAALLVCNMSHILYLFYDLLYVSSFQRFQSMVYWPHGLGQDIMVAGNSSLVLGRYEVEKEYGQIYNKKTKSQKP